MTMNIEDYSYCRFSTDAEPDTVVGFAIYWPSDDELRMPAWSQEEYTNTIHIPGSNLNDTYFMGSGPLQNGYDIFLATIDEYNALKAMKAESGTLWLPKSICELTGYDEIYMFERTYVQVTECALMSLSGPSVVFGGDESATIECSTSWQINGSDDDE